MNDRTYYRQCETRRLIEEARDSDNELCIALGERLDDLWDIEDERDELLAELRQANTLIDYLRGEILKYETERD